MSRRARSPTPLTMDDVAREDAGIFGEAALETETVAPLRSVEQMPESTRFATSALRAGWAALFGRPPPNSISGRLLEYAASYHIQAKRHGGLKPAVRRRLLQVGGSRTSSVDAALRRKPAGTLPPGSRLVREWRGRSHTVEVAEDGFLYAGRHYRSLSEVARAITGARWSGPRFFGL